MSDAVATAAPVGLGFGDLAELINVLKELAEFARQYGPQIVALVSSIRDLVNQLWPQIQALIAAMTDLFKAAKPTP